MGERLLSRIINKLEQPFIPREKLDDDERRAQSQGKNLALPSMTLSIISAEPSNADLDVLTHTDLSFSNILVDETGSITGIIDWDFASTLPLQSAEHYPLLLADKEKFVSITEDISSDPLAELQDWRDFYAKQFEGDSVMEEYLQNIDKTIAFENILRDNNEGTLDNLVHQFKFLDSESTIDYIGIPFPWTAPTKSRLCSVPTAPINILEESTRERLSLELSLLNDLVIQPSRFSKFMEVQKRRMGNVLGQMKGRLNTIWGALKCRKRDAIPDIEIM
jgi:Phosphotransferase enzyme family